jgi:hypothetical protein
MSDRPTADDLLEEARRSLTSEVIPQLSGKSRYVGLMIANALGIARREFVQEGRRKKLFESGLAGLGIGSNQDAVRGLRSGKLGGQEALYDLLLDDAEIRTAIASPEALKSE